MTICPSRSHSVHTETVVAPRPNLRLSGQPVPLPLWQLRRSPWPRLLAAGVGLAVFLALTLRQMTDTSPTFDEGFALLRGYAAWRTGHLLPLGNPPLSQWLSALGVTLEPGLPDPATLAGWDQDRYDLASQELLWQSGLDAQRLLFLGRFPILLVGVLLGAVTARWAGELFGWRGALTALALHAVSPNLIAHSGLATTDLPIVLTFTLTLYAWHRYTRRPGWPAVLGLGVALGLALASKFSALALLPSLGLLAGWDWSQHRALRRLYPLALVPPLALFTLWAVYGFEMAPIPLASYWRELGVFLSFARAPQTAFLLGQLAVGGWPYYYGVAFVVKTPLTVLAMAGVALSQGRAFLRQTAPLVGSIVFFLAATSLTRLNLGYRYLLPILPLVHILGAGLVRWPAARRRPWLIPALLAANLAATLAATPAFIPYFNELVGLDNGYRVLSDSNVDWGQDLPALARYLAGRPVHLAYFGLADPGYYGITWEPLPAWPPAATTEYVPADPEPGLYAISASNLSGVQLLDVDALSYFRDETPLTVLNHSIFVFEVPERAPATTLVECAPAALDQGRVAALLNGRAVRRVVVDCQTTALQAAAPTLTLVMGEAAPVMALGTLAYESSGFQGSARFQVYRAEPPAETPPLALGPYLSLLSFEATADTLALRWRVETPAPPPASVFVHLLRADGSLAANYDGLGVAVEDWRAGDVIQERYRFEPPPPAGTYQLAVGLYALTDGYPRYSTFSLTTLTFP